MKIVKNFINQFKFKVATTVYNRDSPNTTAARQSGLNLDLACSSWVPSARFGGQKIGSQLKKNNKLKRKKEELRNF